ncbi:hypothetical protein GOV05_00125 [Candidatus Woesearchaeota archaeon]|nr:hypothetical protein [Candidatus Woesearchaeota archaeon]
MGNHKRHVNIFERIVLIVAFSVGVIGFFMISTASTTNQWLELIAIFTWLSLIFLMILAATNEDVKEELGVIIKEHIEETKVIKELNYDLLSENKLLRDDLRKILKIDKK